MPFPYQNAKYEIGHSIEKDQTSVLEAIFKHVVGNSADTIDQNGDQDDIDNKSKKDKDYLTCSFKAGYKGSLWHFEDYLYFDGSPTTIINLRHCHKFKIVTGKHALYAHKADISATIKIKNGKDFK